MSRYFRGSTLASWSESATWNSSFGGDGVDADGTEAAIAEDSVLSPQYPVGTFSIDVTPSVQAWSAGAMNSGWAFIPDDDGDLGWRFSSSDGPTVDEHPKLIVEYIPPECTSEGYWVASTQMSEPRSQTASVVVDGWIYVLGDYNYSSNNGRFTRYDPVSHAWESLPDIPSGRGQAAAAAVDGVIYYFGGNNCFSNCWLNTVDAFDTATSTWMTEFTTLPGDPRGFLTATAVSGKIYVMGGVNSYTLPTYSYNYVYDPATNSWTLRADLLAPRSHHAAVEFKGRIYLLGGTFRYAHNEDQMASAVDVYDPVANKWTTPTSLPDSLRAMCGAAVANGRIYVIAGARQSTGGNAPLATVDEFDPQTGCWKQVTALPSARAALTAASVDDVIYAIGGHDGAEALADVLAGVPRRMRGDVNGDGAVDLTDLAELLANYGRAWSN